jgi:site-specific DNA-cytosine methylase
MLEKEVDEKYYLTDTFIAAMNKPSKGFNRAERFEQSIHTNLDTIAFTVTSKAGSRPTDNFIDETKEYANYITWLDDKGRLNTQDHRAYFEDRLSGTIPAMERGVPNVITKNIVQKVLVRKHEVDIQGLKDLLRSNKNKSNQELSNTLNLPLTQVEHWFRQDASFSIPPKEIWFKLKELLNIKETKFDNQVVDFVEKDGEYDMSNRVYDDLGISPTLTTSDEKKVINNLRIRKLTPRECYRLMGFGDQAFDLAAPNQSNSSLYHQAGDSIVVNVLMELFRSLI